MAKGHTRADDCIHALHGAALYRREIMPMPTAQQIAATIRANVSAEAAGLIDWSEFTRRQRTTWDLVTDSATRDRVLDIICGRA